MRVLVHLHIYYHDQVDYFIEKLKNINGVEWDLKVTYSSRNEDTIHKLTEFKPDTEFIEVENFGYDVWPFIRVIKDTDLSRYDLVLKLHTKRSMGKCRPNIIMFQGYDWRNALVDGILYNREHFSLIIEKFKKEPRLGMLSNLSVCVTRDYYHEYVKKELDRLGLKKKSRYLCMGTMFIMRTAPLKILKKEIINEDLFKNDIPISGTFFQTSHLYERIFSHLPINTGLKYKTISPKASDFYKIKTLKAIEPLGKFIFSCQKEGPNRIKVIRIFRIKVYKKP